MQCSLIKVDLRTLVTTSLGSRQVDALPDPLIVPVTCLVDAGIVERASPRSALQPMWLKFDDEKVMVQDSVSADQLPTRQISLHPEEEVKKTSGGSEGPIAYLCLYGRSRALAEGLNFDDQIR